MLLRNETTGGNHLDVKVVGTDGVNRDGIGAVVRKLRSKLPRTQVLVLGVFPCGQTIKGRLRGKVTAINALAAKLADGKRIHYLDIGEHFLQKDGSITQEVMYDYLHLTERGYRIWARALEPTLKRLMKKQRPVTRTRRKPGRRS